MSMNFRPAAMRRLAVVSPLLSVALLASGCLSSPTYGTDKTATEQLVQDVTSVVSLAPPKKAPIDYKPRAELVKPAPGQAAELPAPQQRLASADNPEWPESPEQRRARLRQEATENQDNPGYKSPIINDMALAEPAPAPRDSHTRQIGETDRTDDQKRQEVLRLRAEQRQGSPTNRKYLSEPPLDYRQPAATAATDELGEDELKKQRRAKKAASKGWSVKDYIPWL